MESPEHGTSTVTFDDLSLFVSAELGPHLRAFLEFEDAKFWTIEGGTSRVQHHGDLERLYVDYLRGDDLQVRIGKFLTPVGAWNEIHPDPLTWTVSRPLATYATFPTFVTGLMASGTQPQESGSLDYAVFLQAGPCLDCATNARETERLVGGRLQWRATRWEVGIPVLYFVDRLTREAVTLTGVHAGLRRGRLDLRGEATVARVSGSLRSREYAAFGQAMWALTDHLFLVGQAEQAASARSLDSWHAWTAGVLVRPVSGLSFKVDLQDRTGVFPVDEAGTGRRLLASVGVLF